MAKEKPCILVFSSVQFDLAYHLLQIQTKIEQGESFPCALVLLNMIQIQNPRHS